MCHVYAIRQDGGAIFDLFFLNFTNWKLKFCKNVANSTTQKVVYFPVFDIDRTCRDVEKKNCFYTIRLLAILQNQFFSFSALFN